MEDYTVRSVERACMILEILSEYPKGIGITKLAEEVGMYKSTVHRLLSTLMKRGFIEQNIDTGHYHMGYTVLDLGMKLLSSLDLRAEAAPFLHTLADVSLEVAHLAILEHGMVVYVDKVESKNTTRMHSRIGKRVPAHATGLGKVILAFAPVEQADAILRQYGLPALTPFTMTDHDVFMASLDKIRQHGYATDIEENQEGISCVAAPIFDANGRVIAACSVSGPSIRINEERIAELVAVVVEAGRGISDRLGYRNGQETFSTDGTWSKVRKPIE